MDGFFGCQDLSDSTAWRLLFLIRGLEYAYTLIENEHIKRLGLGRGFVPTRHKDQTSIRALIMLVVTLWLERHTDVILVLCDDPANESHCWGICQKEFL